MGSKIIQKVFLMLWVVSMLSVVSAKDKPKGQKKIVVGGQQGVLFQMYDLNKDGKISREEFLKVFNEMDLDKDGTVDLYETNQYYNKIKQKLDKDFDS